MATGRVSLQILLRPQHRTPEGVAAVCESLTSLGIQPTAKGAATVSATVGSAAFDGIFGPRAKKNSLQAETLATPATPEVIVRRTTAQRAWSVQKRPHGESNRLR